MREEGVAVVGVGEGREQRHHLRTVSCVTGAQIHLAFGSEGSLATHTLCGLPVRAARAAGAFLAMGCRDCAELATEAGLTLAVDEEGAAVSIAHTRP